MNAPIAEDLERDMQSGPNGQSWQDEARARLDDAAANHVPGKNTQSQVMTDLLDGQQRLISAQHQYMHDGDMQALLTAQRNFILCQTQVMNRMGLFG